MDDNKSRVYISGAITGVADFIDKFGKAETMLRNLGFEVVNPAKCNLILPKSTTWQEYMDVTLCMLKMCDTIFMLEGWETSKGANIELSYALGAKMRVLFQEEHKFDAYATTEKEKESK